MHPPPPVTKHVPVLIKSLCKNMSRASANNMHLLGWGGGAKMEKTKNGLKTIYTNVPFDFRSALPTEYIRYMIRRPFFPDITVGR